MTIVFKRDKLLFKAVFKSPFDVIPPGSCIVFECIMYTSRMIEAKSYQFAVIEYIACIDQAYERIYSG